MQNVLRILVTLLFIVSCSHNKNLKPEASSAYTKTIKFEQDGKEFSAELRLPEKFSAPLPTVLIVHEWWGRTERMAEIAEELNKEGYAALAVDLYGNGKTVETPKEAQELATPFYKNPQKSIKILKEYLSRLSQDPHVDPEKFVAIGYCFGGTQVLNLARTGADLAGVVSFHGNLNSTLKASSKMPPLLILNGAADPMVPPVQVKEFKAEMKRAKANYELISYPNATHAFTNPQATAIGKKYNIPIAYDQSADKKSWMKFMEFLKKIESGEL